LLISAALITNKCKSSGNDWRRKHSDTRKQTETRDIIILEIRNSFPIIL